MEGIAGVDVHSWVCLGHVLQKWMGHMGARQVKAAQLWQLLQQHQDLQTLCSKWSVL